jgi:ABC-type sugar transport system ATPase subunit
VAIGRAIVRRPKVFLFDEPLSNLDASLRVQMRIELAKLHADLKTTMIYVTHDQTEAMTLGNRIAVFNQGRIEQVGAPVSLYQSPANTFVAQFLGSYTCGPRGSLFGYKKMKGTLFVGLG